ncbi:radical SAM protein [Pectinatus frisingensis]|uniref:radical SAM protein n=1 Tax=Pectinatus frisingensis TaxID=865 RepID=UPI0018C7855E|nr:radical SAM protein [Pectinatus frisingensis]
MQMTDDQKQETLRLARADYAIYGYGKIGHEAIQLLKGVSLKYICDKEYISDSQLDNKYISPINLCSLTTIERPIVLICASEVNRMAIHRTLHIFGYRYGYDIFYYEEFMLYWYPKILMELEHQLYVPMVSFSVTDFCSLRCKKCSIKAPYQEHKQHRTLKSVMEDTKKIFSQIDYTREISVVGGEPLLWPSLIPYLDFLAENYSNHYMMAKIISNGSLPLSEELAICLKRNGIIYEETRYPETVSGKLYKRNIEFCKKMGICYIEVYHPFWYDFGLRPDCISQDALLTFLGCDSLCRGVYKNRLIYCFPGYLSGRNLRFSTEEEGLSLENITKEEVFCYYYGQDWKYLPKYCKYCNGFSTAPHIPVAEQL